MFPDVNKIVENVTRDMLHKIEASMTRPLIDKLEILIDLMREQNQMLRRLVEEQEDDLFRKGK